MVYLFGSKLAPNWPKRPAPIALTLCKCQRPQCATNPRREKLRPHVKRAICLTWDRHHEITLDEKSPLIYADRKTRFRPYQSSMLWKVREFIINYVIIRSACAPISAHFMGKNCQRNHSNRTCVVEIVEEAAGPDSCHRVLPSVTSPIAFSNIIDHDE
jgi:hypothetical protein